MILIADDDLNLSTVLAEYLRDRDLPAELAGDGEEALARMRSRNYDLCLLDINMPRKNGFAVLQTLRKEQNDTPVFMFTARNAREDMLRAYSLGCDDYITKPFSMEVLHSKLRAYLLRQARAHTVPDTQFLLGGVLFDSVHQTLGGMRLPARESDLLLLLCRNANHVVDRHLILRTLWQRDDWFSARSLAVFITKLRRTMEQSGCNGCNIVSVRGRGYRLTT
ncbi:MAG: response regulator transcription factor [Paludibacteraceae bacterium]|nr:response regulator transcription factor [Paludibacteraceae bacterium]MBR1480969.1 response regulator transcription factor [Paludibacteraceae bacterium]